MKSLIVVLCMGVALNAFDFDSFVNSSKDKAETYSNYIVANIDRVKNMDKLEDLAKAGDSSGMFYFASTIEKVNTKKAIKYYKKAIKNGNYKAAYNLGLIYMNNKKFLDYEKAKLYMSMARKNNIKEAILPLAVLSDNENLFLRAIKLGIKNAELEYALYLKSNHRDFSKIAKILYGRKENFVLEAESLIQKNKKEEAKKVLREGISNEDTDSKIMLASIIVDKSPKESLSIVSNLEDVRSDYIRGIAYFNLNKYKESLEFLRRFNNRTGTEDLTKDKIKKICEETNYCLDF